MSVSTKTPPRFLPTLTEVVNPPVTMQEPVPVPVPVDASLDHEQIVDRVMQRLDVSLESRLRDALDTLVLEQRQAMEPLLRQEIELLVRQAVAEAVAVELNGPKPD